MIKIIISEPIKTECLHRDPRSYGGDGNGLLADGVAGKSKLYCDVNENF